jgi:chitin disaccharide deacetylase
MLSFRAPRPKPCVRFSPVSSMLRVIINADDLGYSRVVNRAVFDWMARQKVSSASLIANAPCLEGALERIPEFPGVSFGVHLNVEEFAPLRPQPGLAPLLNDQGCFARRLRTVRRSPSVLRAVYGEWCAQIDRLRAGRVPLSHLDSHYHAHNLPEMLPLLAALRRRYGIPAARITMNLFAPSESKSARVLAVKGIYNGALRYVCGFRTTDAFAFLKTAFQVERGRLERSATVELMTHPGHPGYEDETQLLGALEERLPPHRLITYRDLGGSSSVVA